MPGPRKRMYVDKGVENDDVEKKRKVETGKDIDVDIQALPSMATAPCMSVEAKSGEIMIHQEVTDETRRHKVRITCKDKVMFENSVTVSREMDMGSTDLDIGQYIRGKVISPDSLRLVMGSNGEIKLAFNVDN